MSLTNILEDLKKNSYPIRRETLKRYLTIIHYNIAPFMKENKMF
jgi:hypothetical protein